ncbi:MAG: SDR family oxidoreductase [Deltaproteobacteria bacterium]|nr:SDR family oxidoreductase [Deltaproteobacteria bacterium]
MLSCEDLPSTPKPEIGKILITGASGYVGGRLVHELIARGYQVRVMARTKTTAREERWPDAEIVVADALEFSDLKKALKGVHTAYYLIHSLLLGHGNLETKKIHEEDIQAAINFRIAAEENHVKRIVYLGGLGGTRTSLSPHLKSGMQVAEELEKGKVPVTRLYSAMIIGAGSAPYEILKHLAIDSPVLLIPRWARTKCQPICIRDVIKYLIGVLEVDETSGKSFDICGKDLLSYEMMLKIFADLLGAKVFFIPSPVSSVTFFSYVTSLLTPVPMPITRSLMEGVVNEAICGNDMIKQLVPIEQMSYIEALQSAMSREERDAVYSSWSDEYPRAHELSLKLNELRSPPTFSISYSLLTPKGAASLFQSICRIGGKEGWLKNNWMWWLRGLLDRMLMGVGSSRGRRSSNDLRINDVIDFWRVEDIKPNQRLLLRAEMMLPGRGWLEFSINREDNANRLSVTAYHKTNTMWGRIYWHIFMPFHKIIFYDLIDRIEKRASD